MNKSGFIHSVESFGTVDGPGIRFVVFFQGCPMRCLYCHNPDTWHMADGQQTTVEEILSQFRKNKAFYQKGGITATGGEPLLQLDFLTALFEAAKAEKVHTCLDTSGITFRPEDAALTARFDRLMAATDLIMLDLKQVIPERHQALTGQSNENILAFARYAAEKDKKLWIRHVVVPGWTDDEESLTALGRFMAQLKTVKALDVLPYHTLGVHKYQQMGMDYLLEGVQPLEQKDAEWARSVILQAYREYKQTT
ncbi:MAG: pyruvate formate lyase-activating protein [Clostridia bacterium]|nr:pyruvate formate lyase-activating protein [Clostridia bacterium]